MGGRAGERDNDRHNSRGNNDRGHLIWNNKTACTTRSGPVTTLTTLGPAIYEPA